MLNICDNADILSVLRIVKIVITIIRIAVPIILIISLSLSYMSAVKDNDSDALAKANKGAVGKVIAAILVFLIPTFVNLISNISSFDSDNYLGCMDMATNEGINTARLNYASNRIENLKENLTNNSYNDAVNSAYKIKNQDDQKRVLDEIESYKKYVEIQELINKLKAKMNRDDRKKVGKLVKELDDSDPYKERFTAMLKEIGVGEPLDIKEGIYEFNHNGMRYFVYMPKDATTNMPLLLWLHGDNCREEWARNSHIPKTAEEAGYSIIQVNPFVGRGMGTNPKGWYESGLLPTVKEIVDEVCERYKCDTSNINIGGHSRGAIGTWMMVSRYPNFFHAAAPVSCCSFYGMNAESFKGMKVWATRGSNAGKGDDNDNIYAGCMQSDVNAVKKYAKEVRYIIQPNTTHGDATNELSMSKEFVEFMFED